MKATDLSEALNHVDDAYLLEMEAPEKECKPMKNREKTLRMFAAAALIALLCVTAYAADLLKLSSLETGRCTHYENYADVDRAVAQAGLCLEVPETLGGGFAFRDAEVREVIGRDESRKKALTFQELNVYYTDPSGTRLVFGAYANQKGVFQSDRAPDRTETVNGIVLSYRLDHYRFVPADYKLTEEDARWEQQPGNCISYGSEAKEEEDVAFLCWEKDGVSYSIMDPGARVSVNALFSAARELLEK